MSISKYEIRPVVCDYGIYFGDKLLFICNSHKNAKLIKAILEKDDLVNKSNYVFNMDDFKNFINEVEGEKHDT